MKIAKKIYIVVLIIIIFIIVALISCGRKESKTNESLYSEAVIKTSESETIKETEMTKEQTESIEETTEEETKGINYQPEENFDYDKMKRINEDYACWIKIPGTGISLPVVFKEYDNDYYLHRTFDTKKTAYAGTLFIDGFSEKGLDQDNLIIYGHNMKNGSMFGNLHQYENKDYFNKNKYIEIHTKDEIRIYEIFSVRDVSSDIDTLNFALDGFTSKEYMDKAIKESINSREVESDGQIVTLSTCVGDYSRRFLVSGIRVQ